MIERGTNLFNREVNLSGVVLDGSDHEAIKVLTVEGLKRWPLKDCDVVEEFD